MDRSKPVQELFTVFLSNVKDGRTSLLTKYYTRLYQRGLLPVLFKIRLCQQQPWSIQHVTSAVYNLGYKQVRSPQYICLDKIKITTARNRDICHEILVQLWSDIILITASACITVVWITHHSDWSPFNASRTLRIFDEQQLLIHCVSESKWWIFHMNP